MAKRPRGAFTNAMSVVRQQAEAAPAREPDTRSDRSGASSQAVAAARYQAAQLEARLRRQQAEQQRLAIERQQQLLDQQQRAAELDEEALRAELEQARALVELTKAMSNRGSRAGGSIAGSSHAGNRDLEAMFAASPDLTTGSMVPLTQNALIQHELLTLVADNADTLHVHGNTQLFAVHTPNTSVTQHNAHLAHPPAGTREGLSVNRGVVGGEGNGQEQPRGSPAIPRTWVPSLPPPGTVLTLPQGVPGATLRDEPAGPVPLLPATIQPVTVRAEPSGGGGNMPPEERELWGSGWDADDALFREAAARLEQGPPPDPVTVRAVPAWVGNYPQVTSRAAAATPARAEAAAPNGNTGGYSCPGMLPSPIGTPATMGHRHVTVRAERPGPYHHERGADGAAAARAAPNPGPLTPHPPTVQARASVGGNAVENFSGPFLGAEGTVMVRATPAPAPPLPTVPQPQTQVSMKGNSVENSPMEISTPTPPRLGHAGPLQLVLDEPGHALAVQGPAPLLLGPSHVHEATEVIRRRLIEAHEWIEHRVHEAAHHELEFASEVHSHMHGQLRHEASHVQQMLSWNLGAHGQIMQAEHFLESEWTHMQARERSALELGAHEAMVEAERLHASKISQVQSQAMSQIEVAQQQFRFEHENAVAHARTEHAALEDVRREANRIVAAQQSQFDKSVNDLARQLSALQVRDQQREARLRGMEQEIEAAEARNRKVAWVAEQRERAITEHVAALGRSRHCGRTIRTGAIWKLASHCWFSLRPSRCWRSRGNAATENYMSC